MEKGHQCIVMHKSSKQPRHSLVEHLHLICVPVFIGLECRKRWRMSSDMLIKYLDQQCVDIVFAQKTSCFCNEFIFSKSETEALA